QDPQAPDGNTFTQSCNPIRDFAGNDITAQFNPIIGPNCLEVPLAGQQTKDGAFDGGYAFADYCPNGYDLAADACNGGAQPQPPGPRPPIPHLGAAKGPTHDRAANP